MRYKSPYRESIPGLLRYILSFFILIISPQLVAAESGPLFLQVHITNSLNSITQRQLDSILSGDIKNFKQLGGGDRKINIYCDKKIKKIIMQRFNGIIVKTRNSETDRKLLSDRSLLCISDVDGLRPYYRVLYIDNRLPWGEINNDYSVKKTDEYRFISRDIKKWDRESSVTVVQTGVTAMTRAFIREVEKSNNLLYPVKYTARITRDADISITSNEVSFLDPCRYPPDNHFRFCSPSRYFKILLESGFDIIELSGNHNNDFGIKHNLASMELLERNRISYFGGGKNIRDAEKILYRNMKGMKFAFLGFNQWGPKKAWATKRRPGALRLNRNRFVRLIKLAVSKADIVLVSVQWGNENNPVPHKTQKQYFRLAADLGASIMLSSSAHRAMGLEFYRGKFISYGLGNFLFDQMHTIYHRRGLIARHHFYKRRHIQTELIPYMIYNHSQPRLLHNKERLDLMKYVFRYSLGKVFREN